MIWAFREGVCNGRNDAGVAGASTWSDFQRLDPLGHYAGPATGARELLVRVLACGVCRTDLHVAEGDLPVHRHDVVPGHEIVGEVIDLGPQAGASFQRGDRVGIPWLRHTCGTCRYCTRGDENLCPFSQYTGWDHDGGYAEYATVPSAYALALPTRYTDAELAPLLCAGIIGFRALHRAELPVDGGAWVSTALEEAHISLPRLRWPEVPKCM